jgi:hypothetical protein
MADFDWTKIAGPLIGLGGNVVGGLIGGPAGAVVGPMLGKVLADALGVPATPDAVGGALQQPNAGQIVQQIELQQGPVLKTVEQAYLDDIQNARNMGLALVDKGSIIAWAPVIVSVIVLFAFGVMAYLVLGGLSKPSEAGTMVLGAMTTAFGTVVAYWLGSSQGSRMKDTALASAVRR